MATKRNKRRRPAASEIPVTLTPSQRILLSEANRSVTIVSDGQQQEVKLAEVVFRKLLQKAASGSVHALSNAANEMIVAEQVRHREIERDVEFGDKYKRHQQMLLDRAQKVGSDPDTVLPHPDDILVIDGIGFRIVGPVDEATLRLVKDTCARRDVMTLQFVLENRLTPVGDPERSGRFWNGVNDRFPGASPLVEFYQLNRLLPPRFRMSDDGLRSQIGSYERLPTRVLLKIARRAWASIGKRKPRGWIMPTVAETEARKAPINEDVRVLISDIKTRQVATSEATEERIFAIARKHLEMAKARDKADARNP